MIKFNNTPNRKTAEGIEIIGDLYKLNCGLYKDTEELFKYLDDNVDVYRDIRRATHLTQPGTEDLVNGGEIVSGSKTNDVDGTITTPALLAMAIYKAIDESSASLILDEPCDVPKRFEFELGNTRNRVNVDMNRGSVSFFSTVNVGEEGIEELDDGRVSALRNGLDKLTRYSRVAITPPEEKFSDFEFMGRLATKFILLARLTEDPIFDNLYGLSQVDEIFDPKLIELYHAIVEEVTKKDYLLYGLSDGLVLELDKQDKKLKLTKGSTEITHLYDTEGKTPEVIAEEVIGIVIQESLGGM